MYTFICKVVTKTSEIGGEFMCYNCGCQIPDDDMGSKDNITNKTLEDTAAKLGKSVHDLKHEVFEYIETKSNNNKDFEDMFEKAANAWGQSIDEAKKNTHELLKSNM